MREIRFRAWIKNDRRMIEWFPQFFADTSPVTSYGDDFPENDDNVVLMQYTGLTDKNGVEIYEGDVLKESGEYSDGSYDERVFDVEWLVDDIHSGWNIAPCDTWYSCVIGNIYEHPDLLK